MRVLEVRPDNISEDISAAQSVITNEIARPSTNVMIIKGSSPEIAQFADRADVRSEPFPFRQVLWVKDGRILSEDQEKNWFENHDECAVVLDFSDQPVQWLSQDAELYDIEKAFLEAQDGGNGN